MSTPILVWSGPVKFPSSCSGNSYTVTARVVCEGDDFTCEILRRDAMDGERWDAECESKDQARILFAALAAKSVTVRGHA